LTPSALPWLQTALFGAFSWILATVLRAPLEAYSKKLFARVWRNDQAFLDALGVEPHRSNTPELRHNPAAGEIHVAGEPLPETA
jgi:hypothetical protein